MEQHPNIQTFPDMRERRLRERRERAWRELNEAYTQVGFALTTVSRLMREDSDEITEAVHADAYDELKHVEEEIEALLEKYEELTRATGVARIVERNAPLLAGCTTPDMAITRIIGMLEGGS